jgi:hypothetical protein
VLPHRFRAVAFDPDADSLAGLRGALPGWEIEVVNGATAASITQDWNRAADLLFVGAHEGGAEASDLCRFLVFCGVASKSAREGPPGPAGRHGGGRQRARPVGAPLVVLLPPGQGAVGRAALAAGAAGCLGLPVDAGELVDLWARVRHVDRPGPPTIDRDLARALDRWRDDGGRG